MNLEKLREHNLERLDVYVFDKHVASLVKEGRKYVLSYLPTADPTDYVSISMPVRAESWVSDAEIHPFFEMNLPEGYRREIIEQSFGKVIASNKMSLLAITGNDAIGRVSVVPSGFPLRWKETLNLDIQDVMSMSNSDAFFADAIQRFSAQGVSGVQPKILATSTDRMTFKSNQWIIKKDGEHLPWLSLNEFLSMNAARKSGLDVAECLLGQDGKSLFIKRFDVTDGVQTKGFEDMCSLFGLRPTEKYGGSAERLLKIASLVTDAASRRKTREDIIRSIAFNMCIGNSDGHLKNYGVLYDTHSCVLSPLYDMVSIRAFESLKNDIPSLSIGGKKEWSLDASFKALAMESGLSKPKFDKMIQDVVQGVTDAMPTIDFAIQHYPEFASHAKAMRASWESGIDMINGLLQPPPRVIPRI